MSSLFCTIGGITHFHDYLAVTTWHLSFLFNWEMEPVQTFINEKYWLFSDIFPKYYISLKDKLK